MGNVYFKIR